jgi:hypothetical protein
MTIDEFEERAKRDLEAFCKHAREEIASNKEGYDTDADGHFRMSYGAYHEWWVTSPLLDEEGDHAD